MSLEPHLAFYNSRVLGQPNSIEKVIAFLLQDGFDLFNFYVGSSREPYAHWDTHSQITRFGLEKAYDHGDLTFTAKKGTVEFELFVQLNWNTDLGDGKKHAHTGAVTFQTDYFRSDNTKAEDYSRFFLDFGRLLYSVIEPDFGWIDFHEPVGSTWFDDIDRLAVPYVYWANFFGKAYTIKYGIDNIISSPAWLSELLNDEGVLVVLSPTLGFSKNVEQVKSYYDDVIREVR